MFAFACFVIDLSATISPPLPWFFLARNPLDSSRSTTPQNDDGFAFAYRRISALLARLRPQSSLSVVFRSPVFLFAVFASFLNCRKCFPSPGHRLMLHVPTRRMPRRVLVDRAEAARSRPASPRNFHGGPRVRRSVEDSVRAHSSPTSRVDYSFERPRLPAPSLHSRSDGKGHRRAQMLLSDTPL